MVLPPLCNQGRLRDWNRMFLFEDNRGVLCGHDTTNLCQTFA